jgi:hypothetical protein
MKIAKETWIILAIGLVDLATTILFIRSNGAQEANPLFKRYWEMGLAAFVVAKVALLVGPLYVLEWARKRNPHFVSLALRTAIVAYIAMYGVGYYRLNHVVRPQTDLSDLFEPAVHLPPRVAGRPRHLAGSIRQASYSVKPESAAHDVIVY